MSDTGLALEWLRSVGKEKIQSFQDNFSEMYDLGLCLITLSGSPLTVWSSESLLCHYMQSHNLARCQLQRQQMIQKMCRDAATVVDSCYLGMTSFICPVLFEGKPIAAFFGGPVDTGDCGIKISEDFSINPMSGERLREIGRFLESIIAMVSPGNNLQLLEADRDSQQLIDRFALTPREFTIVEQIMTGKGNKEIAGTLFISEKTVKSHITNILRKMQARDRKQIMLICKNYFKNW